MNESDSDSYRDPRDSKRRKIEHPAQQHHCWDWMLVGGKYHYARNKSSFTLYRAIPKRHTTQGVRIVGIGAVEIHVKIQPGSPEITRLRLRNVLHMPEAPCNGFCAAKVGAQGHYTEVGQLDGTIRCALNGMPVWYGTQFHGARKLALQGNPQGASYLTDGPKALDVWLSEEEEAHLQPYIEPV